MASAAAYIEIKSLQASFWEGDRETHVLEAVNLSLERGKIGVLIGPSGCGKSTLLSILAGLKQDFAGEALINGKRCSEHKTTALILQDYGLLPWKQCWQNVILGLQIRNKDKREINHAAAEIMEQLGIAHLAGRYPAQLSGGQRQRVAIARALVLKPDLLLMDEPFSSLDALTREEMQELILKIWRQNQTTIFVVTHDIEEAAFLGQHIFVMSPLPGRIVEQVDNKHAGDLKSRGKREFYEMCTHLRGLLRRGEQDEE